ncbi:uncharacterized protein LOC119397198 [Rhipicephalus sanguineus]|uniref:uncharacterized protein LOC119397198 n=1 Tax=Rhipicephalus sanguineus TaxID=34632 RepID=UPI0020C5A57C|nr:uncharacterized protein LOC119397198 [Rhipicephalus sanguineus]
MEVVEEALHVLVEDMVQQELEAIGEEYVLGEVAELTAASLLEEETEQLSTATCTEEYLRAEEQRLQEKLLAKRQAREDEQQAQEQLVAEILREGLQNETEGICRGCHQEALGQWQSSQSELILASLLDEVPLEESSRVARDSLAEEWAQHEDKHRRAELFYRHSLMAAAFANTPVDDSFLRIIWLQRPYRHAQAIPQVQANLPLDQLAHIAGRVVEVFYHRHLSSSMLSVPHSPPPSSCAVSTK